MPETGTAYENVVLKLHNTISDEIEIARGAEQLASWLVDTLTDKPEAHRQEAPCCIGAMDLLPLRVILSRHVASLEEILAAFNAL
jgi:hypothetical protein